MWGVFITNYIILFEQKSFQTCRVFSRQRVKQPLTTHKNFNQEKIKSRENLDTGVLVIYFLEGFAQWLDFCKRLSSCKLLNLLLVAVGYLCKPSVAQGLSSDLSCIYTK